MYIVITCYIHREYRFAKIYKIVKKIFKKVKKKRAQFWRKVRNCSNGEPIFTIICAHQKHPKLALSREEQGLIGILERKTFYRESFSPYQVQKSRKCGNFTAFVYSCCL